MNDSSRTDQEPIEEISALKRRIQELEQSETERKRAEAEIHNVEIRYRLLFERSPYGIVIVDPATMRFVEFNETAHRQLGYSREEFAGLSIPEIEVMETPEETLKRIGNVMRTGRDDFETMHRTRQGEKRNVHVTAQATDISGHTVYHCVWSDITGRKQAEKALKESEERFRSIANNLPGIVFQWYARDNGQRGMYFVDRRAEDICGVSVDPIETWSERFDACIAPEDKQKWLASIEEAVRTHNFWETEARYIKPTGEEMYVRGLAQAKRLGNELVSNGLILDVTARKRAELALLESEAKYRTIVENSLEGVYVYQDARFHFVNKRFCEIFGYSYEEVIEQLTSANLIHPEDAQMVGELARKLLTGEIDDIRYAHKAVRKDGATISVNVIASSMTYRGRPAISGTVYDVTEQAKAEEQLRQKTALLEAQVNTSLDGILIVHKGKKILQNQRMSDLFNIPRHIVDDEDDEPQFEWVKGLVKNPEQFHEKVSYLFAHQEATMRDEIELKDGRVFDRYASPIFGKDGMDYGRIWTFRDITEYRKSEEALRASRAQLSEAMDLAHIVCWELDIESEAFIFNDPFYAFYGATAEEEGGYRMAREKYAQRFIHPDDLPRYYQFVEQNTLRQDPGSVMLEHRMIRRDGEVRHILARSRIVRDDSGRIVKRYGANQDITERKLMEEEIARERSKLKILSDNAPFGMVLIDKDGYFTYINPKFTELFGFDLSDVPDGRTWFRKAFPNAAYRHQVIATRIEDMRDAKPGAQAPRAFTVTCKDGTEKVVSFITSVLVSGDHLMACEDITELKRLESQLRQAQKMEAIGTLAGGIAHDFNNILTVITGYSALLKMEMGQNDPQQSYLEYIRSSAEKAAYLTRSLLSFSRQQPLILTHINLNQSLRSMEKILKRLLTENIAIKTILSAEDITIKADGTQIDQILFNLATNARDAMPRGGVLTMETKAVELDNEFTRTHGYGEPGRYALLTISDTGAGMDEATRERIFDPFFTTKEAGKGTGLGLSSVYGAVKQHNGYITVYSELNMGTTFHIYLPAVSKPGNEEQQASSPVKGGNETILIAEDNDQVRDLIIRILSEHGYATVEAIDGENAVEQFTKAGKIDLLILDSVMPKKSGREAYNEIHELKPDIKVIFTSGYTRDVVLDKGIEDKKFEFLSKPISPNVLLRKVREALDERVLP
jgi:two-component system, cell cycle sensor histidine kinase and response regulator CckA